LNPPIQDIQAFSTMPQSDILVSCAIDHLLNAPELGEAQKIIPEKDFTSISSPQDNPKDNLKDNSPR